MLVECRVTCYREGRGRWRGLVLLLLAADERGELEKGLRGGWLWGEELGAGWGWLLEEGGERRWRCRWGSVAGTREEVERMVRCAVAEVRDVCSRRGLGVRVRVVREVDDDRV